MTTTQRTITIMVAADTRPGTLGGCIANCVRKDEAVALRVIGAGALNQAIKAVCAARQYLHAEGLDISVQPHMFMTRIHGDEMTGIELAVVVLEVE